MIQSFGSKETEKIWNGILIVYESTINGELFFIGKMDILIMTKLLIIIIICYNEKIK